MIYSFRHRGLKRLYERGDRSRVPADMADKIEDILAALDVARSPEEMDRPYFRLHPLTVDRKGQWAVTVRANWGSSFASMAAMRMTWIMWITTEDRGP